MAAGSTTTGFLPPSLCYATMLMQQYTQACATQTARHATSASALLLQEIFDYCHEIENIIPGFTQPNQWPAGEVGREDGDQGGRVGTRAGRVDRCRKLQRARLSAPPVGAH